MQAHPLSTSAARISLLPLTHSASRAASTLLPSLLPNLPSSPPPNLAPAAASAVPAPALPPRGIAEDLGLAHDAGNLLGALQLYSDLLRAPGVLGPEHQHYAAELGLIAARSSTLLRRLLPGPPVDGESHRQHIGLSLAPPGATDHAAALRALAPILQRIAGDAASVHVATHRTLPAAQVPVEALERIAVNLVRNASEAIRASRHERACATALSATGPLRHTDAGQIHVVLGVSGGALRLSVEDNGPGIPPVIAAAFLRPGSMPVQAERGLGHRIVHELTESTGGKLSIRVRPGRGTTLCVRWPLATAGDASAC